jgi:hypothetical protein
MIPTDRVRPCATLQRQTDHHERIERFRREQAGDDELGGLGPTERAEGEQARGMAQRVVIGPRRALDEERNDEERSGDHSTDQQCPHARPFFTSPHLGQAVRHGHR